MSSNNDQINIPLSERNVSSVSEMIPNDMKLHPEGAVLSFHNISYRVKMKSRFLLGKKTVEKDILSNISGIMRPGLNAIFGPPGSGKSVLLDILAARKHLEKFSGDVLINGEPYPANFKCYSGYVTQDDVMMGTLTVRENLRFSAAIRLPTTMTNHEKNEKINETIQELGLDKVADCKVGTELIHGVSKAERKKISIAMELVTDPSILFLDKPTNALDLNTAYAVFLLLKRISKKRRTIIFSIHELRHPIFEMFDSLTLLTAGKLIFHGPAQMAAEHLASAGYNYKLYINSADFLLDVISGVFPAMESDGEEEHHEYKKMEEFSMRDEPAIENLAEYYANSSLYRDTKAELDHLLEGQKKKSSAFQDFTYVTSFWQQFRWISWRSFKNFLGDHWTSITQIINVIIEGLLISAFFLGIKNDCTAIQNRIWMLFLLTDSIYYSFFSAIQLFQEEKKLFMHEYMCGYYTVSSYFLGKVLCDMIPRRMLHSFILTFIPYVIVGLKPAVEAFFITMLTILMMTCSAESVELAMTVGQSVLMLPILTFLIGNYFWFMLMFYIVAALLGTNGSSLQWFQYINIAYFGLMALQNNELLGQNFCPPLEENGISNCPTYVILVHLDKLNKLYTYPR
ncbi:broad substrate specificity ATP-binding cassette transporter ABCG2-like isoform X2 [Cavia porcellus]|uniref:broad substrate specificity ATP-binding cassette transporter ABCG2-like isoform X2 n=1 Tax=Cavia porcellus TaxID=10141 RepID=UPI002FE37D79